jgi:hypothetical protein
MLAEKIKVLLKNAAVARELGENARGKISELLKVSAPHIKMMELYRKLGDC